MQILDPAGELEPFLQRLHAARQRALLLDYDGTLAPFTVARDQAVPYAGVRPRLEALVSAGQTRVVIISGRAAAEVSALLNLGTPVEIWGSHAWERRLANGEDRSGEPPRAQREAIDEARKLARQVPPAQLERKPFSLALHWRGMENAAQTALAEPIRQAWQTLVASAGLELHEFDGGMELRIPGRDKGYAVRTLAEELGPDTAMAYLGDDRTDEDAFRAIAPLGLGVLVRETLRATAATLWLQPPTDLLWFLDQWKARCPASRT